MLAFYYRYVEFYFFTHPTLFINNHFPMEEKWQLISPRISLKIFENMVFRTGDFFEMGLKYIHPDVQVISTGTVTECDDFKHFRIV